MKEQTELNLSEKPAIDQLKRLGYIKVNQNTLINEDTLLGSLKKINKNIPEEILIKAKQKLLSSINKNDVFIANKFFYKMLTGILSVRDVNVNSKDLYQVKFIDFNNIENNKFEYSNQQKINKIIPDILIYINGLPLSIIEAKSPTLQYSIKEGVNQLKSYEERELNLFKFIQICTVISGSNAVYGTYNTPIDKFSPGEKFENQSRQETLINMLYQKENLLDIINNFILHENKQKIIARYIQYRATKKTLKNLEKGEGGIIFHYQGSGKSYTMVYIAKLIFKTFSNPTIIVVTDRTDLDQQIFNTFLNTITDIKPDKAQDKESLKSLCENNYKKIILTTIHKFEENIQPIQNENIFIFSDESHRTQYSNMGFKLRSVFPNAKHIAFTGTPIEKTNNTFGEIIDSYTMKESIEDQVTLPIFYNARYAMLENINKKYLNDISDTLEYKEKKAILQSKMSYKSEDRISKIAFDMISHYKQNIEIDGFKAMFVAEDRDAANKMKAALDYLFVQGIHDIESRVIFSLNHNDPEDYKQIGTKEDMIKIYTDFKKKENKVKILIVSDMLLTGYDAPILKAIYIDKNLKEHTLFQAITRVNRIYKNKGFGLIVDYRGIAEQLNKAINSYNSVDYNCPNIEDNYNKYLLLKNDFLNLIPNNKTNFNDLFNYFIIRKEESKKLNDIYINMQEIVLPIIKLLKKEDIGYYYLIIKLLKSLKDIDPEEFISSERLTLVQNYLDNALSFTINNLGSYKVEPNQHEINTEFNSTNLNLVKNYELNEKEIFIAEELELLLKKRDLEKKQSINVLEKQKEFSIKDFLIENGFDFDFVNGLLNSCTRDKLLIEDNFIKLKGDLRRKIKRIVHITEKDKLHEDIITLIKKIYNL